MDHPTIPPLQKHLLVVEDNDQMRQIVSRVLEIEGYIVLQAQDGQAALEILQCCTPDLILSDIHMPQLDGINFCRAVRKNPNWVAIPFIFLTSFNSPGDVQAGRELGVEDFLIKPVDHHELVKIVNARLLRTAELQIAYMDRAYLETVNVLANMIEGRDTDTHGHVERVAFLARWLAEALHWPEKNLRALEFGARLHDIGKIIVPDHILNKPGTLTPEEWELMKRHTLAGAKILSDINHLKISIPYVLYHHEQWDGRGYPHGLQGRKIPLEGRLLAIVDVYDALTSKRPYHPARPHGEVIQYLRMCAGRQFDPDLTGVFIQVLEERGSGQAQVQ